MENIRKEIERVLSVHFEELKAKANVLGFSTTTTKIKDGKDTGQPCLRIIVSKKMPLRKLAKKDVIPKEVEGIITDVYDLSMADFEVGKTPIGDLPPWIQRRMQGVKKT